MPPWLDTGNQHTSAEEELPFPSGRKRGLPSTLKTVHSPPKKGRFEQPSLATLRRREGTALLEKVVIAP